MPGMPSNPPRRWETEAPGEIRIEDCVWYHHYDFLENEPHTPAVYDLNGIRDKFLLPEDLSGKRCLDIGTASGFFTFEMEKRGADVVSFDLGPDDMWDQVPFSWFMHRQKLVAEYIRRQRNGYWYAHKKFNSKASLISGNVLDVPKDIGPFDLVFIGAILQHVHDPIGAIIGAARLVRETLIISEAYMPSEQPVMLFQPKHDIAQHWTWWTFSPKTIENLLRCLGFMTIEIEGPFDCVLRASGGLVPSFTIKATRPKFPDYAPGTSIDLSATDVPYLIAGWGPPSPDGRKIDGPQAALGFNLVGAAGNAKDAALTLDVTSLGDLPESASIEIFVNRYPVGELKAANIVGTSRFSVTKAVIESEANKTITIAVYNEAKEPCVYPVMPTVRSVRFA